MNVKQLYTNCLSEAAYFVWSEKEAVVIDPIRDVDVYLELAAEKDVTIKYIFETHFHADFVSGHLDLARKTGATIVYGPQTQAGFSFLQAKDQQIFPLGKATIKAIHTPGHTLESTSYLLYDEHAKPYCIFTGDTLFVGDVGRPDLFSGNLNKEELASMMYDSLNSKIKTLPDDVLVYPAHGPGSACGKNLGKETFSTIGEQKRNNYALQDMTKEQFIRDVTTGLSTAPAYFPLNAQLNQKGYNPLDDLFEAANRGLSLEEFDELIRQGAWILDTRPATTFTETFIPDSINIGLDGRFAEWAGILLPFDKPLVLVTEPGKEKESITRLARVGIDQVRGFLKGGVDTWIRAGRQPDLIVDVTAEELAMDLPFDNKLEIIDVRKQSEYDGGHVRGARFKPLDSFRDLLTLAGFDDESNLYIHCAGGYRSVIAASLLKRQGFHNLRNVLGGYTKIKEEVRIPLVLPGKENT